MGLVRPKFLQFRLANEPASRAARKVARLLPRAGTGEAVPVSIGASSFSLGVAMLIMFRQYRPAFRSRLVLNRRSGWSVSARYMLVLPRLNCPPTSSCGLLTGSSAIGPFWFARADSSFSACDALCPARLVLLGAVNGVQPSAGSTNLSSRPLSLPLLSTVALGMAATLAAVACADLPVAGAHREPATAVWLRRWS